MNTIERIAKLLNQASVLADQIAEDLNEDSPSGPFTDLSQKIDTVFVAAQDLRAASAKAREAIVSLPGSRPCSNDSRLNFDVIVTRDTTESCCMVVEATDADEASRHAIERSRTDFDLVWEQDDTINSSKEHYLTHCEVLAEVAA